MGMGYQDLVKRSQPKATPVVPSPSAPEPIAEPTYAIKPIDTNAPAFNINPPSTGLQQPTTKTGFPDALSFIRNWQDNNVASQQSFYDLADALSSAGYGNYGGRFMYGQTPSNNELLLDNGKFKVYSEGGNKWYRGEDEGAGGGGSSAGAPMSAPQTYGSSSLSPLAGNSEIDSALQAAILKLLGTDTNVDPAALFSSPEARANRLAGQRSEERQRAQLAEESAAEGWSDSGGFDTGVAGIRQQRGEGEAQFLGQLATAKAQEKRDLLLAGIQAAQSTGQFEKSIQLQQQLAALDAAIKRETLAQQNTQFGQNLGYNYADLNVRANSDATRALLGL